MHCGLISFHALTIGGGVAGRAKLGSFIENQIAFFILFRAEISKKTARNKYFASDFLVPPVLALYKTSFVTGREKIGREILEGAKKTFV